MNRYAKSGARASSRSDAIRKLIIKGLGQAGKRAVEKDEAERLRKAGEAIMDRHVGLRDVLEELQRRRR